MQCWSDRKSRICDVTEKFNSSLSAEHYLSSSNYMDCISSLTGSNGCNLNSLFKGSDLPELFSKLGLGKYTDVFQQQEVSVLLKDTFVFVVCFYNSGCSISWPKLLRSFLVTGFSWAALLKLYRVSEFPDSELGHGHCFILQLWFFYQPWDLHQLVVSDPHLSVLS